MKHLKSIAAAAVIATVPLGAHALSFNVLNSSSNVTSANSANSFAGSYGAFLNGSESWVIGAAPITKTGSVPGAYLSPWANTTAPALANVNSYFVVQPNAVGGSAFPATPDPAKLLLGGLKQAFTFLWGSIDVENKIEFRKAGGSVASFTGTQIVGATGTGGGTLAGCGTVVSTSYQCVATVSFTSDPTEDGFDEIWFHAGGRNSFEFAAVPLPAAAWLLLGVSGALVAAKRRSHRKTA